MTFYLMITFFIFGSVFLIINYNIACKSINSYLNGLTLIYGLTGMKLVAFFSTILYIIELMLRI